MKSLYKFLTSTQNNDTYLKRHLGDKDAKIRQSMLNF